MKVTADLTTPTSTTLVVSITESDMVTTKEKIERQLSEGVKMAGFRPGKVPPELATQGVDQKRLYEAFLTDFVPQACFQALELKGVKPVLPPDVSVTKFVPFKDLEITIKADHLGEIGLADYKNMSETLPETKVSAANVSQVLERVRLDFATYTEVDRASALEDRVWIDFDGFNKEDQPIAGAASKDYPLILGSQTFIPGFEEKLIGFKKGQNLDFKLKFPSDYAAANLAGAEVEFKVVVNKVEKVELPPLNDSLAVKTGVCKTLVELKKVVKKQITADKQRQAESVMQGRIVAKLAEQSTIEIPDGLVKLEFDKLSKEHEAYLKEQSLTLEQWLKETKLSAKDHDSRLKQTALNRIKGGVVLREFALREKIEADPEEIEKHYENRAREGLTPQQAADMKNDIRAHLLTQKALEKLTKLVLKKS